MKLTILKEVLEEGIKIAEEITIKNFHLPILQNLLLTGEKSLLNISATNLETGVKWWGLAKIEKEGKICLPTKLLSQLVHSFSSKLISLWQENFSLYIEGEGFKSQILGVNPEEFPVFPQIPNETPILVDGPSFCRALFQVMKIPSPSSSRPEISGIFLNFQGNVIKVVATDSFRLAEKKVFLPESLPQNYSLIIPQSAAKELISIFGEKTEELRIYISPHQVWFESLMSEISHPKIHYTSRLIEGEYPAYEEIIPKKFNTTVFLSKEEFLKQIKTASIFSGKTNEIKLKIDPKTETVTVFSQSPNLGSYEACLKGKIKGQQLNISFNHRFLTEGINEIKTSELNFEFTDQEGPAVLRPVDLEDYFYVLMPIKTI